MTTEFDAAAYKQKLIDMGTPEAVAAETAEKMAAARQAPAGGFDLARAVRTVHQPAPAALVPAPQPAPVPAALVLAAPSAPAASAPEPAESEAPKKRGGSRPIKPPKTPRPRREVAIAEAAAEIITAPAEGDDIAMMHSVLCQVGLPRSKVADTEFIRRSGSAMLSITAGRLWDGKELVQQPIPYGPLPRLILAWLNTYARRHNTPHIKIGDSALDFMRMIGKVAEGKGASGGATGSLTMFKRQMLALAACRMTIGFNAAGKAITYDGKPISAFEAWLDKERQAAFWPGSITFSHEYFSTLSVHSVPIDFRAYAALKGSSFAMDIYTFLADRLHRISGRPVLLHWANLRAQFGQEYKGKEAAKDFKGAFLLALHDVLKVYPSAKVQQVTGGLLLFPSAPPIAYKE